MNLPNRIDQRTKTRRCYIPHHEQDPFQRHHHQGSPVTGPEQGKTKMAAESGSRTKVGPMPRNLGETP